MTSLLIEAPSGGRKPCICCGEEKPLDNYYTHPRMNDGHLGKCKECVKAYQRRRHYEKMEDPQWREGERSRSREKLRQAKSAGKAWASPRFDRRPHSKVSNAIRDGRLIPANARERCGHDFSIYRREGHHPDYGEPLVVEWLCVRCHRRHHREAA